MTGDLPQPTHITGSAQVPYVPLPPIIQPNARRRGKIQWENSQPLLLCRRTSMHSASHNTYYYSRYTLGGTQLWSAAPL